MEKMSNNCNCKHNHSSNSDEPCCRCDSRKTNTDRIRSMSDEELAVVYEYESTIWSRPLEMFMSEVDGKKYNSTGKLVHRKNYRI